MLRDIDDLIDDLTNWGNAFKAEDVPEFAEYVAAIRGWHVQLTSLPIGKHEHPHRHVEAGHDVRIFFPDWHVGYVHWNGDEPEIYDTKGTEAGETDEAWCDTCNVNLDVELLGV